MFVGPAIFLAICLFAISQMKKPPIGGREIKLAFIPTEGSSSGYYDCKARDSMNRHWQSKNNVWTKV